ncbi:MAG: hypothetical protein LQ350_006087 [Teloschistes chrysophthalmus]|nr:MAG: hypothetical protein LQ350_006087 [Niorma chrysophthalma]
MPIFQEPEQRFSIAAEELRHASPVSVKPAVSDPSGKTDIGDGTLPSQLATDTVDRKSTGQKRDGSGYNGVVVCTSDRNELMERIKRGESPTWIPSQTLQAEYSKNNDERPLSSTSKPGPAPLLPAVDIQSYEHAADDRYPTELSLPSEIKRPRSALHAGDFNRGSHDDTMVSQQPTSPVDLTKSDARCQTTSTGRVPFRQGLYQIEMSHPIVPLPDLHLLHVDRHLCKGTTFYPIRRIVRAGP